MPSAQSVGDQNRRTGPPAARNMTMSDEQSSSTGGPSGLASSGFTAGDQNLMRLSMDQRNSVAESSNSGSDLTLKIL